MNANKRSMVCVVIVLTMLAWQFRSAYTDDTDILPIRTIENATASAVSWRPDGTQLAVGDATGINLYTLDLEFIRHMEQPTEQMKALVWSPDGRFIAASGANDLGKFDPKVPREKKVYIWRAETGELVTIFDQHKFYVSSITWSPDSKLVATGSWDRTIRIWNPFTGEAQQVIDAPEPSGEGFTKEIMSLGWSSFGDFVAVVGNQGLYKWKNFESEPMQLTPNAGVSVWSPNGKYIALGSGYYDLKAGKILRLKNCALSGFPTWSPDSTRLATYTWYDGVFVCDPFNDTVLAVLDGQLNTFDHNLTFGYQDSLSWHPDGNLLAGAAGDGWVRIWDMSSFGSN